MRLETERLVLRKPELGDRDGYADSGAIPRSSASWAGRRCRPEDVPKAIERMLEQWERHGVGLFSVLRKEDQQLVGRVGYLLWDTERWVNAMHEELDGDLELEIGWTIIREFWNQGYATEAALACRDHALGELGRDRVISLIAKENMASIRVAEKIGERWSGTDIGGAAFKLPVDLYALEKTA